MFTTWSNVEWWVTGKFLSNLIFNVGKKYALVHIFAILHQPNHAKFDSLTTWGNFYWSINMESVNPEIFWSFSLLFRSIWVHKSDWNHQIITTKFLTNKFLTERKRSDLKTHKFLRRWKNNLKWKLIPKKKHFENIILKFYYG